MPNEANTGTRAYVPGKQVTVAHLIAHPAPDDTTLGRCAGGKDLAKPEVGAEKGGQRGHGPCWPDQG